MNWILSHRWRVGLFGVVAIIGSCWFLPSGLLQYFLVAIGVVAILSVPLGLLLVVFSSPGGEATVDEDNNQRRYPRRSLS